MRIIITAVLAALLASAGTAIAVDNARIFPGGIDSVTTDPSRTNLGVKGNEASVGTAKITHVRPVGVNDANASAVSLSLEGAGTAAQGIFLNAPSGTSGKLLNLRNAGVEILTLQRNASGVWELRLKGKVIETP